MSQLVNLLFVALWMFFGFIVLRFLLSGYFREQGRPTAAAAALVVAFALGANWPYSHRPWSHVPGTELLATPPAATAAPATVASVPKDVSSSCRAGEKPGGDGTGYGDGFGIAPATDLPFAATITASGRYYVRGWAEDAAKTGPPRAVCLVIDGAIVTGVKSTIGYPRPDVATALNAPAMANSGYRIEISGSALPKGEHSYRAASLSADGTYGFLTNTWVLTLR